MLWAYKTSQKTSIGTTPYTLAFGHDVMILIELIIQSLKNANQSSMSISDYQ